jgi:hypothetical protein
LRAVDVDATLLDREAILQRHLLASVDNCIHVMLRSCNKD